VDILKAITKSMKISKDISFIEIGKKTKGFSGADLKYLVK
jgi:ATP-dependent 26S proteasome regulatory subunit